MLILNKVDGLFVCEEAVTMSQREKLLWSSLNTTIPRSSLYLSSLIYGSLDKEENVRQLIKRLRSKTSSKSIIKVRKDGYILNTKIMKEIK